MNKFSALMNMDEKDVAAISFANKAIDRYKILKHANYYYKTFCSENDYSHSLKSDNGDTVTLYYGGENILSIYFQEKHTQYGYYVWVDCNKQKIIFFNNPINKTNIYFMKDELSIDGEWFSYTELDEYSFQLSTVNNLMAFLLKNV